ncbi:hypothetical protein Dxin01_01549 [Deinococcus xinjiangensis]|uniref:Uncharacterized protein n=1 Tax=Deinococcus xinjiangensis TaxID=457454 RepID=A0ABP9V957_9DEIO
MNAPAWRIWLTVALMCGWGILGIRFAQKQDWAFVLMCVALFIVNGITLWRLTKNGK